MGSEYSAGLPGRPAQTAPSENGASPATLLCGTEQSGSRGGEIPPTEGCYIGDSHGRGGVLLQPVLGTQEGRGSKTRHQLKSPEPVRAPPTFQNGGVAHTERSCEARRLASKDRSKGCIPDYPHGPGPSEILEVQMPGQVLPIQLPPIWPSLGTMGLYQDPQASSGPPSGDGCAVDSLYRRHTNPGRDQGASPGSSGGTAGMSGLHHQLCQVGKGSNPEPRVSGDDDQYHIDDPKPTARQVEEDTGGVPCHGSPGRDYCQEFIPFTGQDERHGGCDPGGSPLLSPPSDGFILGTEQELTVIRRPGTALPREQRGTPVVGQPHEELERQVSTEEGNRPCHRLGCIPDRLGCSLSGPEDRRTLVRGGEVPAHKLPGVAGSNTGNPDLHKRPIGALGLTQDRQYHSSGLCEQHGRDSLQASTRPDKESLDVVHGEKYSLNGTASARCPELYSRRRVSDHDRQNRLDAEPTRVQTDPKRVGPNTDRSICIQTDRSVPAVLQLAPRPSSPGNRCLPSGLVTVGEGLCQPTVVSGGKSSGAGTDATGPRSPDRAGLEDTGLVPSTSLDAGGISVPHQYETSDYREPQPGAPKPPAGRMEYLRERYRGQKLSEKASALMLES